LILGWDWEDCKDGGGRGSALCTCTCTFFLGADLGALCLLS
jgi:hypothetical protein